MSEGATPAVGRRHLLTSLLGSRLMCGCILGAGALHVGLTALGLGGWSCPILNATGYPCPGCGLGRACVLLGRGDWSGAWQMHAFAPLLVITMLLIAASFLLPEQPRAIFLRWIRRLEDRTPIVPLLGAGLVFYWVMRLTLDGGAAAALIR